MNPEFKIITIPFEATEIRKVVKQNGGKWLAEEGSWLVYGSAVQLVEGLLAARKASETRTRIAIPYMAEDVRTRAKELGARWDHEEKVWLLAAEVAPEVQELLEAYEQERATRSKHSPRLGWQSKCEGEPCGCNGFQE